MRIRFQKKYVAENPVVVKLWFGQKYFIWKFIDLKDAVRDFVNSLSDGSHRSMFPKLCRHIERHEIESCVVEVILSSRKGELLLSKEQSLLSNATLACLNENTRPAQSTWVRDMVTPKKQEGIFSIKGRHRRGPAVIRIDLGDSGYYMIWKGLDATTVTGHINRSMALKLKYGCMKTDPFYRVVDWLERHPEEQFGVIRVIYKSMVGAEVFQYEKEMLRKCQNVDPYCLNHGSQYIPAWLGYVKKKPYGLQKKTGKII